MYRVCALSIVLLLAAPAQGEAQQVGVERYSGQRLADIYQAWEAVRATHEPHASLSEFRVTYTQNDGQSPTIAFFSGPTFTDLPGGSTRIDLRMKVYFVTLFSDGVRVVVGDENTVPQ